MKSKVNKTEKLGIVSSLLLDVERKSKTGKVLWYDKGSRRGLITCEDRTEYGVDGRDLLNAIYLDAGDEVSFKPAVFRGMALAREVFLVCTEEGPCMGEECKECCPHDQWDRDECVDCGKERCPGVAIDRAMDRLEDR